MILAAETAYARECIVSDARLDTLRTVRGMMTGLALGALMWAGFFRLF